jgi:hypothetical protein
MPEPKKAIGGWTVDTLRDHVFMLVEQAEALQRERFRGQDEARNALDERYAQRFSDAEKALHAAITAADRAVSKAEEATTKRFESVNEFRGALSDQARSLMPRLESERRMTLIEERLTKIEQYHSERSGATEASQLSRSNLNWAIGVVVGVVIAVAGIVVGVMKGK